MQIAQFRAGESGPAWCGVRRGDERVVNLAEAGEAAGIGLPLLTRDLLGTWQWRRKAELAVEFAEATGTGIYDAADLVAAPPVSNPEKVVCVGLNYRDHAEEGGHPIPEEPVLFAKFPTAINAPGRPITWDPTLTQQVDYEAELVIVIGRETREVQAEQAGEAIAGYLVGNDVSARDLQDGDGQWVRGKSLDTFAPIGPAVVTSDEVTDPHDLDIWTEVNGERLQESNTSNLIFGVDEIVAFCSRAFTLRPGDLIFTGTPPGVGVFRDPQVLLEEGDTVTVGIQEVGTLTNPCAYRGE